METGTILFGRYLLYERISLGTMAEIWLAARQGSQGFVAIKRLRPSLARDAALQAMFVNEAKIAVQLAHPNIAQVFDLGLTNGEFYIELEYLAGADLRAVLTRSDTLGVMPWDLATYVAEQVCDALDHVHRKAGPTGSPLLLVHRDVAPDNVMLSYEGEVKLVDFSAATRMPGQSHGVGTKGRSAYYSPELMHGQQLDRRSDVYSVGVVLYEAITGRRLAVPATEPGAPQPHCCRPVLPPRAVNPAIPPDLERIVLTALEHDRSRRYQWASELGDALRVFMARLPASPSRAGLRELMQRLFATEVAEAARRLARFSDSAAGMAAPERGVGATFEFEIDEGLMAQVVPHPPQAEEDLEPLESTIAVRPDEALLAQAQGRAPVAAPAQTAPVQAAARSPGVVPSPPAAVAAPAPVAAPTSAEEGSAAQRKEKRWSFAVPVKGVWGAQGRLTHTLDATLVNLSTTGALLRTAEDVPIPVDAEVGFTIPLRLHNMIALSGVVRWTRFSPGGRELGVEFLHPHPELLVLHRTH